MKHGREEKFSFGKVPLGYVMKQRLISPDLRKNETGRVLRANVCRFLFPSEIMWNGIFLRDLRVSRRTLRIQFALNAAPTADGNGDVRSEIGKEHKPIKTEFHESIANHSIGRAPRRSTNPPLARFFSFTHSHLRRTPLSLCFIFFFRCCDKQSREVIGWGFGVVRAITPNEKIKENRRLSEWSLTLGAIYRWGGGVRAANQRRVTSPSAAGDGLCLTFSFRQT